MCTILFALILLSISYNLLLSFSPLFHYENLNKFSAKYKESIRNHKYKVHYCHMTKRGTSKKLNSKMELYFNYPIILISFLKLCPFVIDRMNIGMVLCPHKIINPNNTKTGQKLTVWQIDIVLLTGILIEILLKLKYLIFHFTLKLFSLWEEEGLMMPIVCHM